MVSKHFKIIFFFGIFIVLASFVVAIVLPPNLAPEFSGSALFNLEYSSQVEASQISNLFALNDLFISVEVDDKSVSLETKALDDELYLEVTNSLKGLGEYSITSFESFSPEISQELIRKSIVALIFASILIILFISFSFRNISSVVSSWKYGVVSVIALIHDVVIPFGVFSIIGVFTSASLDVLFVTALLAVIGYSINDTVVVFDRVRERLSKSSLKFEEAIDLGVKQSIRRSLYTSISTLIPLVLLSILVPVTKWFAFTLFVGILVGTYSSLFFAPAILVMWQKYLPQKESGKKEKDHLDSAEDKLMASLKGVDTI